MSLTYKEIKDQYQRLSKTKEYLNLELKGIGDLMNQHDFIVYVGCGSSYSLAKSYATSTMTILNKKSMAIPAGDILLRPNTYTKLFEGALIIAISRSGTTSEIIMAVSALREVNCNFTLFSISASSNKTLANLSQLALEMPWAFDESVCQTSAVTNFYYTGQYILAKLSGRDDLIISLERIADIGESFINSNEEAFKKIAHIDWNFGVTLADAEISGVCEEASLTFKEICQLPSNHYPVLDVRHGPIVVMNEKTIILVAINNVESELERNLIKDLQMKQSTVITISDLPLEISGTINFNINEKSSYSTIGLLLLNAAQLITYFKAVELNVNPDEPSGLDAWINLNK